MIRLSPRSVQLAWVGLLLSGTAVSDMAASHLAIRTVFQSSAQSHVPSVPRLPLGVPAKGIPAWEKLSPSCRGTKLRDIKPCMQSFVAYGSVLGLVTLVDRRDHDVHLDAVGHFKSDTIFQIMSMSKPFVAVLVMKLIEEGKIASVNTRVASMPGFQDFPYRNVTIRQLLTHTSGIWYLREPQPGIRIGVAPHLTNSIENEPDITVRDKSLDFVAKRYLNPSLYPLGSIDPQYSNIGYTILGWIVERVSGRPYDRFLKETVFDKLGMKDTFFFPSSASSTQRPRIADVDRRLPDPLEYRHYDKNRTGWMYPSPEGGIYSTAEDLRRFLRLFRYEGQIPGSPRVLNRQSIARLMHDELPGADFGCSGRLGHSLGFYVVREPGCPDWPGLRPGTIQHDGRFSTDFWYDPAKDEIGIFLYQIVTNGDSTPSLAEDDAFKQMLERIDP